MQKRGMSTSFKIIGGYAIILAITLAIVILALVNIAGLVGNFHSVDESLNTVGEHVSQIVEENLKLTNIISDVQDRQMEQSLHYEKMLRGTTISSLIGNAELKKTFEANYTELKNNSREVDAFFKEGLAVLDEAIKTEKEAEAKKDYETMRRSLESISQAHDVWEKGIDEIIVLVQANNLEGALAAEPAVQRKADEFAAAVEAFHNEVESDTGLIAKETEDEMTKAENVSHSVESQTSTTYIVTIVVSVIAIALAITIGIIVALGISRPLMKVSDTLKSSSGQIASAANQLSSSSQEIASGSTEQASSIEETTSSMEELASMVRQNLQNAKEASTLSEGAAGASKDGYTQMERMLESMKEINKSSDQISKVIKIIDDIAFQTNILALNAAVEAARAGEAGMGFAVVADEVKNLANRSAEAAKETSGMIESSIKKTEEGLAIATRLAESFKDILNNIQKVSEMTKEVETASTQQDSGINQVNKAIVQFDEVVQANASAAEETASSAEELQAQVETLNNIVGDLVLIVTGRSVSSNGNGHDAQLRAHEVRTVVHNKTARVAHQPVKAGTATASPPKRKVIAPEKLIPFEEDEEFKDTDTTQT